MGFEKAVQFDASQAEQVTQLNFGDTARPERFESNAFQSHARDLTAAFDQLGRDSVRNVNSYVHSSTLRAPGYFVDVLNERGSSLGVPLRAGFYAPRAPSLTVSRPSGNDPSRKASQ